MSAEERLAALEAKVREMTDRQEIWECIRKTARGNDRFDIDLITGAYHEGAIHELGLKEISGQDYGEHANHAHRLIADANMHNVSMPLIELDGDTAHAETYNIGLFLDPGGETARVLAGRYLDRLERRDGEWKIVLRRATVEVALEGKAILPNGSTLPGSGYLRGDRDRSDPSYERPLTAGTGGRW
ncbi:MAG: nuclear transport factor 2 family protein [Novosphingobium sp.]